MGRDRTALDGKVRLQKGVKAVALAWGAVWRSPACSVEGDGGGQDGDGDGGVGGGRREGCEIPGVFVEEVNEDNRYEEDGEGSGENGSDGDSDMEEDGSDMDEE